MTWGGNGDKNEGQVARFSSLSRFLRILLQQRDQPAATSLKLRQKRKKKIGIPGVVVMKASITKEPNAPFEVVNDVEKPKPGADQILVKSIVTAINPV